MLRDSKCSGLGISTDQPATRVWREGWLTNIWWVDEVAVDVLLQHAQRHRQLAVLLEQLLAERVDGVSNFRAKACRLAGARLRASIAPAVNWLGVAGVRARFPVQADSVEVELIRKRSGGFYEDRWILFDSRAFDQGDHALDREWSRAAWALNCAQSCHSVCAGGYRSVRRGQVHGAVQSNANLTVPARQKKSLIGK